MWQFDLQLFSQAPSSELVTIGIGKETTFGTAVTPTVFLIPSSENWSGSNSLIERPGARKRVGQSEQLTGMYMGTGQMQVEVDPDTAGALLLLTMGAEAIAVNTNNPTAVTVSTTLLDAVPSGFQPATPTAMTGIVKGQSLTIGSGGTQETVVVRAVSTTQFWALFKNPHAAAETITNAAVVQAQDHTFTLASPRPSFTTQVNEVIAARNCFGSKVKKLSMKLDPKAVLEFVIDAAYQGELVNTSPTTPTYSTLRGFTPFATVGSTVSFNGSTLDQSVQGMSIDIETGLITDFPKLGNGRLMGQFPETQTKVTASLDLAFESETALQAFYGQIGATGPQSDVLPVPLSVYLQSNDYVNTAVPYGLSISLPMAKFENASQAVKMKDYIKQTVKISTSETTNGAGDDVKFVLTNANSAASL